MQVHLIVNKAVFVLGKKEFRKNDEVLKRVI